MQRGVRRNKKAQGLPITTIIIAILGLVVLVILFAITTGRLAIFGRATAECPGTCVDAFMSTNTLAVGYRSGGCDKSIEREVVGSYVASGQSTGTPPDQVVKCGHCCLPIA